MSDAFDIIMLFYLFIIFCITTCCGVPSINELISFVTYFGYFDGKSLDTK